MSHNNFLMQFCANYPKHIIIVHLELVYMGLKKASF